MPTSEDSGTTTLDNVMEVYDDTYGDTDGFGGIEYVRRSRWALGIAVALAASHAVAFLSGQYAVSLGLLVVALLFVGATVADRLPTITRR